MPDEPIPYSELQPERCEPARGAAFVVPGDVDEYGAPIERDDEGNPLPLRCGEDPRMPPAATRPYYERPVNLGYAGLKRRGV